MLASAFCYCCGAPFGRYWQSNAGMASRFSRVTVRTTVSALACSAGKNKLPDLPHDAEDRRWPVQHLLDAAAEGRGIPLQKAKLIQDQQLRRCFQRLAAQAVKGRRVGLDPGTCAAGDGSRCGHARVRVGGAQQMQAVVWPPGGEKAAIVQAAACQIAPHRCGFPDLPGPGQKDVQASSPARKAISSPATLMAISAGVSAPMARPMGAWTRSVSSFVSPASHMSSFVFAIFFRLPITPT